MVLFDELSNKWRAIRRVVEVFKWWVSTKLESIKQWVDLESTRAQNRILLRWFWSRIKGEVRETKSEWGSERADVLSQTGLITAQRSSTWPLVCAESWGSLSIFPRISQKQLLKCYSPWEWPWSTSWDRSPACSLLHYNRDIGCFWDTSCAYHWSTCYCWTAWKRGSPTKNWVVSWK